MLQEWIPKFEQPFGHCSVTMKMQIVTYTPIVSYSTKHDGNLFPLDDFFKIIGSMATGHKG